MRRKFIAGNWKMNLDRAAGVALATAIVEGATFANVDVALCPPSCYLEAIGRVLTGSRIGLGAQNASPKPNGAFTGELSMAMLLDSGCKYVILGHSERRQFFHETDADVNEKAKAALAAGLIPIVCVGEKLEDREAGRTAKIIETQFTGSCAGLSADDMAKTVIAYEPVWAIGTGRTATPQQAEEVHSDLRKLIASRYTGELAEQVRIQYGGSVNAANAADLLGQPDIDGALVGGASLKAADFLAIIAAAAR